MWADISNDLKLHGHDYDPLRCANKWINMRRSYYDVIEYNKTSMGLVRPKTCPQQNELHQVLINIGDGEVAPRPKRKGNSDKNLEVTNDAGQAIGVKRIRTIAPAPPPPQEDTTYSFHQQDIHLPIQEPVEEGVSPGLKVFMEMCERHHTEKMEALNEIIELLHNKS